MKFFCVLIVLFSLPAFRAQSHATVDYKHLYQQAGSEGSFVLFDRNQEQYTFYNEAQSEQGFIPASTFKIFNSLVGLETGMIKDENFVIAWDSVDRGRKEWNQSQDLKTAFKNSTVWYYQSLARKVGGERMKYWLDKAGYGNADTSGGIDQFWLKGGLRITPRQQVDFLQKLYNNELPFSQRSMDIVKKIMIAEQTPDHTLRAKTGWSSQGIYDIGWYVGYVETKGNVYFFANCMQTANFDTKDFGPARKEIAFTILDDLGIRNNKKLKIEHLAGDYYIFTTWKSVDGTLIPANGLYALTKEGAVMIDTPWDETQFQPLLDSIMKKHGQEVVLCVPTHSHADRTAGLEYYAGKGIKTYSTRQTKEICLATNERAAEFTFGKDTVFTIGEHRFETFYPGEGHTADNIVVWIDDARILYGGCFIKSTENHDLGYIAEANLPEWEKSLQKTMKKYPKAKFVIPGHFSWKSNKGLKHTLKLLVTSR